MQRLSWKLLAKTAISLTSAPQLFNHPKSLLLSPCPGPCEPNLPPMNTVTSCHLWRPRCVVSVVAGSSRWMRCSHRCLLQLILGMVSIWMTLELGDSCPFTNLPSIQPSVWDIRWTTLRINTANHHETSPTSPGSAPTSTNPSPSRETQPNQCQIWTHVFWISLTAWGISSKEWTLPRNF